MYEWVDDPRHRENSSNDRTDVGEELKEVLADLLILHRDWGQLIVEHYEVGRGVVVANGVLCELVYLVVRAAGVSEVRGDCDEVEVGL